MRLPDPSPKHAQSDGSQIRIVGTGLLAVRRGPDSWLFDTTDDYAAGVERHERLLATYESSREAVPAGARLLLDLVFNDQLLTQSDLKAATGRGAQCFSEGNIVQLEWPRADGWRDRRHLSHTTQQSLDDNEGCAVGLEGFKLSAGWLRLKYPLLPTNMVWAQFFQDARAWWYHRLATPAFVHAINLLPRQLLPRSALARKYSGRPLLASPAQPEAQELDRRLALLYSIPPSLRSGSIVDELAEIFAAAASDRQSKPAARQFMVDEIQRLLPKAVLGRNSLIIVLATLHVVENGGVRGELLAPGSLGDYTRHALNPMLEVLGKRDLIAMPAESTLSVYREVVSLAPESQRQKLAAYLHAFHRYVVIAGGDPLLESVGGRTRPAPPAAAMVCDHELETAVQCVWASPCPASARLQGEVGLRLGHVLGLRIEELWCIRLIDVQPASLGFTISIAPRVRDGLGKSPALRRQEDVTEPLLVKALAAQRAARLAQSAADEDVFLGEPGQSDGRHLQSLTTMLMNAALRDASGDPAASFHDLRHTRGSILSEPLFRGTSVDSDVGHAQQVSAALGHACAWATRAYQHLIEAALAQQSRSARSSAWRGAPTVPGWMESVEAGLVENRSRDVGERHVDPEIQSKSLSLAERLVAVNWLLQSQTLSAAGLASRLGESVVTALLLESGQAMQIAGMVSYSEASEPRVLLKVLRNHYLSWAQAGSRAKHKGVVDHINALAVGGKWMDLWSLWNAYLACRANEHIDLSNVPAAVELISFLIQAKVPKSSLLVVSHRHAEALPEVLRDFGLKQRSIDDRPGRKEHRLQMTDGGVLARGAAGATLTMIGLQWVMVQLGAMLMAQRSKR